MPSSAPDIYPLSLHDALPILTPLYVPLIAVTAVLMPPASTGLITALVGIVYFADVFFGHTTPMTGRSEEHTSELQSHSDLVCRLLLEKKNKKMNDSASVTPVT